MFDGIADQVCEDFPEEVVGKNQSRGIFVADAAPGVVADLFVDDRIQIHRLDLRRPGMDPADGGDGSEDLDALIDAALEFLDIYGSIPRERAEEQVGIEVRDVLGVPDIVGQDIEVQVRLVPCLFKVAALPNSNVPTSGSRARSRSASGHRRNSSPLPGSLPKILIQPCGLTTGAPSSMPTAQPGRHLQRRSPAPARMSPKILPR
ncbi:MAG: hypothetical protein PHX88_02690 [Methanoculleus horonobensis]|nr:hypothetical protein [Methanoculleus horonobensis]